MTLGSRALGLPLLAILLCGGFTPAVAHEDAFSDAPPRHVRVYRRVVPAPRYVSPPPVISGYLPRNNAVPMYNEPPGLPSGYGAYRR